MWSMTALSTGSTGEVVVWIKLNDPNEGRSGTCGYLKKEMDKLEFVLRRGVQRFSAHRQSGRREGTDSCVPLCESCLVN